MHGLEVLPFFWTWLSINIGLAHGLCQTCQKFSLTVSFMQLYDCLQICTCLCASLFNIWQSKSWDTSHTLQLDRPFICPICRNLQRSLKVIESDNRIRQTTRDLLLAIHSSLTMALSCSLTARVQNFAAF